MKRRLFLFLSLTVIIQICKAQLCTGSLGDPVVNIDFGSGTGRGSALEKEITSYTYSSSGMPNDGQYTIANNSQ